jgi:hypothetical protein
LRPAVGDRVQPHDREATGKLERIHLSKDGYLVGEVLWDTGARCGEPLSWLGKEEEVQAERQAAKEEAAEQGRLEREEERREQPERECDGCSKRFTPARNGQRFHSEGCRKRAHRLGIAGDANHA